MFYRSNIIKEFQEHISKLNDIDLYNLLQDIMNKLEEESTLYNNWYTQLENINDNMQVSIMSYEQSQILKASLYNNAAIEYIRQETLNCNIKELSIIILAFIESGIKSTLLLIASSAKGVGVRQCRGQSGAEQERSRRNADVVKRQHDLAISPKGRVRVVLPRTYVFCVTHPPTLYL